MRLVGRVPINTIFELMKADYEKTVSAIIRTNLPLRIVIELYESDSSSYIAKYVVPSSC